MKRRTIVLITALALSAGGTAFMWSQQEGGLSAVPGRIKAFVNGIFGSEAEGEYRASITLTQGPGCEHTGDRHDSLESCLAYELAQATVKDFSQALEGELVQALSDVDFTVESSGPSGSDESSDTFNEEDYAAVLRGRVVLEDGTPVSGLTVVTFFLAEDPDWEGEMEDVTREDGSFRFGLPETRRLVGFEVLPSPNTTPVYNGAADLWLRDGAKHELTLTVTRGARVSGIVLNPLGEPAEGVEVQAWCRTLEQVDDPVQPGPDRIVTTGSDGRFSFDALGPDFVLSASAPGYTGATRILGTVGQGNWQAEDDSENQGSTSGLDIEVTGDQDEVATIWMDGTTPDFASENENLAGEVGEFSYVFDFVQEDKQEPGIDADAWIEIVDPAGNEITVPLGIHFEANGLELEIVESDENAGSDGGSEEPAREDRSWEIVHTAQSFENLVIQMETARDCAGRILDADGSPVVGATISAVPLEDFFGSEETVSSEAIRNVNPPAVTTRTNAEGRFELQPLLAKAYIVEARHSDFPRWKGIGQLSGGSFDFQMHHGAQLSGRVFDADGKPLNQAEILVNDGVWRWTMTGPDGRFEILGLEADSVVRVHATAKGHALSMNPAVELRAGKPQHVIFELESGWRIAGNVHDLDGNPVAGAEVLIRGDRIVPGTINPMLSWEESAERHWTTTDSNGAFRFESLYSGQFTVTVRDPDDKRLEASLECRSGSEDLEVTLDPVAMRGAALVGHVRDAQSQLPIAEFSVTPVVQGDYGILTGTPREFVDAIGAFEVVGLASGEMMVAFQAEGYVPITVPANHYGLGDHPFDILLSPERVLNLRIVDENYLPVPQARLEFWDGENNPVLVPLGLGMRATTLGVDGEGRARVDGLPAGKVVVNVRVPRQHRMWEFSFDLEVSPEGEQELVIQPDPLPPMTRMAVVVYGADATFRPGTTGTEVTGTWLAGIEESGSVWGPDKETWIYVRDDMGAVLAHGSITPNENGGFTWTNGNNTGETALPMIWLDVPAEHLLIEAKAEGYDGVFMGHTPRPDPEAGETIAIFLRRLQG